MNPTTSCPSALTLRRLLLGETGEEESLPLEDHLLHCECCRRTAEALPADDPLVLSLRQGRELAAQAPNGDALAELGRRLENLRPAAREMETTVGTSTPGAPPPPAPCETSEEVGLAPPERPDEIGRLGGYRILKELGRGGMGVVYHAEDERLKRAVAVKAMRPALLDAGGRSVRRFLQEAQAMAAVEHDRIVRIYQVDEEHGVPFFAMELLKGETLEERLRREPKPPLAEVLRVGREIAEGLAAAHGRGLIHRDVKPANVWLEAPGGRVKILDFGLARAAAREGDLTRQGTIVGTPAYMAPEQARGEAVDGRGDLFSLGVVLYRLCTGRQPFLGDDVISTLMKLATHEPAPPAEVNPEVDQEFSDLIMRLLAKDPARRPASADEVVRALRALEARRGAEKPAGAAPSPHRRRWFLAVAAAALLAGLIAAAATVIRIQTDRGDYVVETDDPDFSFQVRHGDVTLRDLKANRTYNLKVVGGDEKTGELQLQLAEDGGGLSFRGKTLTIKRGERVALKASVEQGRQAAAHPPAGEDEESWRRWVAVLPPGLQVQAVAARLRERNPRFNEQLSHRERDGHVEWLRLPTADVTDLSPLLALSALRALDCRGPFEEPNSIGPSRLADLSPLKDLKNLVQINCSGTPVSDLSALKGKPCYLVACDTTRVSDLGPLQGMPLKELWCGGTRVKDLSPLRGMPLTALGIENTPVSDLSPLGDSKLTYLRCFGTKVVDLSPLKGMPLTALAIDETPVSDLSPLCGAKLTEFRCAGTKVTDLAPLKGMPLTTFSCDGTRVADLSPLRGMPLTDFACRDTLVWDLSPLRGAPLTKVAVPGSRVTDLSPLRGMALTFMSCRDTRVSDLSPLKGMPLTELCCQGASVTDLSPLKGMPLKALYCDFKPERDAEILRSITTLEKINYKPAKEFWKDIDAGVGPPLDDAWVKRVATMPAEKQAAAVVAELKARNPDFDGRATPTVENGVVTGLDFLTDEVRDVAPVRALTGLKSLRCCGSQPGKGRLWNLAPLKGMRLTTLSCYNTLVYDLSPLQDMPLQELWCGYTGVTDLSPLRGMPLTVLWFQCTTISDMSPLKGMPLTVLCCGSTHVSDLSPLQGMPLTKLYSDNTRVSDLSPLKGMPLTALWCFNAQASDLSPLKGMPLKELRCDFKPERDAEILRSLTTLETINEKPVKEFWKEVGEKKP